MTTTSKKLNVPSSDTASQLSAIQSTTAQLPRDKSPTNQIPERNQLWWIGWLLAIGASFSFSVAPVVGRAAILSGIEPTELLVWRFLSAVMLIWLTGVLFPPQTKNDQSGMEAVRLKSFGLICIVGLANGSAMICFFFALARLDASMTSMVLSTLPIFVVVLLAFFGEPLTQRKLIRLLLAMTGLYLLIGPGGEPDMVGVALALCAVMLFASQLVVTQSLVRKHDPQIVTRYVMTVMLLVIAGYWWVQDGQLQMPSIQGWLYIILLGVISTYAARLLLYAAVRRVGSGQMSLLMPLETLLAITWSVLFLNERLSTIQWVGGLLILVSAALAVQRIRLGDQPLRWRVWGRT
ncbi:MAG: DMT family transporter [Chloroflexota bacterium]